MRSLVIIFVVCLLATACSQVDTNANLRSATAQLPPPPPPIATATPTPASAFPNLQAEILDDRNKTTDSSIGKFDFKNYTYELPRGWQNPDGTTDIALTNGKATPYAGKVSEDMSDEEKVEAKTRRRIGMSYVTTKYLDVTGDGQDEAIVILKVETEGSAIPQIGYVFTWKDGKPELIWPFRTGDRADGGLKDVRSENGMMVVELYGQDRFILGQTETGKVTGDEEQLCCPLFYTRSSYKWNGTSFLMQGKRLTFSMTDKTAAPLENYGDKVNDPKNQKGKK
jgi:hypothetical protein